MLMIHYLITIEFNILPYPPPAPPGTASNLSKIIHEIISTVCVAPFLSSQTYPSQEYDYLMDLRVLVIVRQMMLKAKVLEQSDVQRIFGNIERIPFSFLFDNRL